MILFSHPTGNANVRYAALGLERAGLLGEFWTCIDYHEGSFSKWLLPGAIASQLRRRSTPAELARRVHTQPFREFMRLVSPKLGLERLVRHEVGPFSVDGVYRALDRKVASRLGKKAFTGVYAYEDGAVACFEAAERMGIARLYDLPIAYWRTARNLLVEEAEREPEWAATLTGNSDSPDKNDRKDAELRLANRVFVASSFTERSLADAPDFKGTVTRITYGAPVPSSLGPTEGRHRAQNDRLRVLFVGGLSQRKGLSYLFEACRRLEGAVELTVIGRPAVAGCAALERALASVNWIPSCSHSEVLAAMRAHEVFIFPSLFEGFGLVLLEAMAQGLPVVATPHTAAPDLITDGVEGFIIPIRSVDAIIDRLTRLRADPALQAGMGEAARKRAQAYTWEAYGDTLAACVRAEIRRL